jgi:putative iron-dependent peroxidase
VTSIQPGILAAVPPLARYLFFRALPGADWSPSLRALKRLADGEGVVVGLGQALVTALGRKIPGLRVFPSYATRGIEIPSTPCALWCWLRGDDRGELVHRSRTIASALAPAFEQTLALDAFQYGGGRDLTGYEDGTENPQGEAAVAAATVSGAGPGLDGSSVVAVQQWVHDLVRFERMSAGEQDDSIGRRRTDNEELEDAPRSAHVKRTAQESYDPPAFVLRRSMPWASEDRYGLVFVAFGRTPDAFDALLRRMVGADDGVTDALFRFTRPVTGAYFWCPPIRNGRLDLSAIGL